MMLCCGVMCSFLQQCIGEAKKDCMCCNAGIIDAAPRLATFANKLLHPLFCASIGALLLLMLQLVSPGVLIQLKITLRAPKVLLPVDVRFRPASSRQ